MTVASLIMALIGLTATAARSLQSFAFESSRNSMDAEHFGIVGGRITVGIDHRDLCALRGLWAPPFVSSDLRLDCRLFGQSVRSSGFSWLPFEVRRRGSLGGVVLETATVALVGRRAIVLQIRLRNESSTSVDIPLELVVTGTLDRSPEWGFARPAGLIDYGPSNSHLELRRGYPYNHVMPDLNGRRYQNYLWAERLAQLAGAPAPWLGDRARQLQAVLKRELWDPEARWFRFIRGDGVRDIRWTIQMFKLFGSGVLDPEQEQGLLSHLNEEEFLSAYGIHSMSKKDPAYDQVDIDNGGGGACTSFPPQIIEKLYRTGHAAQAADILERILWWGDRMPYWGDSIVANEMDYRRDTPLQCALDGAAGAQAILFGMFGLRVEPDGTVVFRPQPPAFSPRIALRGLILRGRTFDAVVANERCTVTSGSRRWRAGVGEEIRIPPPTPGSACRPDTTVNGFSR